MLFEAARKRWNIPGEYGDLLQRAALSHEIGMAISHKHFHHHGAYLLRNSDLPGFSQSEQEQLAILVDGHRGKLEPALFADLVDEDARLLPRLVGLLRLAVVFKYVEQLQQLPDFSIEVSAKTLRLVFPADWLKQHPLTHRELLQEKTVFERLGMRLKVSGAPVPPKD
jgi:exopolyphosphatase/guanosine-5'-triphosphate,3'-diphosphate pyrophosphatase